MRGESNRDLKAKKSEGRLTTGLLYGAISAGLATEAAMLIQRTAGKFVFVEWTSPLYRRGNSTHIIADISTLAYSSVPFWVPIVFGLLVPAAVYLVAAIGSFFASSVPDEESLVSPDPCAEDTEPLGASATNYTTLILFFARFFSIPTMAGLLCLLMVEKSSAAVILCMIASSTFNFLQYIADGIFIWMFGYWPKESTQSLEVGRGFDSAILSFNLMWYLIAYLVFYPYCFAYAEAPATIPGNLRVCFILFLTLLSYMTLTFQWDMARIAFARASKTFKPSNYTKGYDFFQGLSHIVHAVFLGVFFLYAYYNLDARGCTAP